jgi:NhaP-type Na+/H+ or K+/H+ antiporter
VSVNVVRARDEQAKPNAVQRTFCASASERFEFIAWFGVRGIGSIYYLAYALSHGVPAPAGRMLADVTLVVVAGSIVLHGISVTPLMQRYSAFTGERQPQ